MYDVFYSILQPSLKDLQLHYKDTDGCILSFTSGNISDEHMDLTNLETPDKTNEKVPGKMNHEFGNKPIEKFLALSHHTYSFKYCGKRRAKEKGIKKGNNAKCYDYHNALMYDKERTVEECRIQKV